MKPQNEHVACTDVFKIFKVADLEVVALRGLDLTVYQSEVVALVGASGSGKSTLLNILAGYDSPSAGQVTIDGRDLINMKPSEIEKFHREEVGFVWQEASRNLFPYLTSLENVALPMLLSTTSESERKDRSEHLLNMVGMEHRTDHIPEQLSGGEQQRVAIAVGMANDPPLILADEPTGELDDRTASEILDLFGKVNQENKIYRRDLDSQISGEMDTTKPLEESLLIDSNGRVQLPRELLQTTGITNKVKATAENASIRIQPSEELPTE
jgi:ABC-type lipoprotein export system ATPase subunit